jgi:hypothetical protein
VTVRVPIVTVRVPIVTVRVTLITFISLMPYTYSYSDEVIEHDIDGE